MELTSGHRTTLKAKIYWKEYGSERQNTFWYWVICRSKNNENSYICTLSTIEIQDKGDIIELWKFKQIWWNSKNIIWDEKCDTNKRQQHEILNMM